MNIKEIIEIIKEYGALKNKVWFYNVSTQQQIDVKYDKFRRYYMNTPHYRNINTTLQRVSVDVFNSNIEYLLNNGYHICY